MQESRTTFLQALGESDDIGSCSFIIQIRQILRVLKDNQLSFVLVVHEIAEESGAHTFRGTIIYALVESQKRRVDDEKAGIIFGVIGKIMTEGECSHGVDKGSISLPLVGRFFMCVNLHIKI